MVKSTLAKTASQGTGLEYCKQIFDKQSRTCAATSSQAPPMEVSWIRRSLLPAIALRVSLSCPFSTSVCSAQACEGLLGHIPVIITNMPLRRSQHCKPFHRPKRVVPPSSAETNSLKASIRKFLEYLH